MKSSLGHTVKIQAAEQTYRVSHSLREKLYSCESMYVFMHVSVGIYMLLCVYTYIHMPTHIYIHGLTHKSIRI